MKKNCGIISVIALTVFFLISLGACSGKQADSGAAAQADAPARVLRYGHISAANDNDPYHVAAVLFSNKVAEKTKGAITIEVIPNGQLGGERDMMEGLQMGTHDFAPLGNATLTIINDENCFAELPFIFADENHAYRYFDSEISKGIADRLYEKHGIKVLAWGEVGFRNFLTSNTPIQKPADLKNKKVRVIESAIMIDCYKLLGANPTPIAFAELFTSLQQGIVDGCDFPINTAYTARLYEVTKHFALAKAFYNTLVTTTSKHVFESLTPDMKKIFEEAGTETAVEQRAHNRAVEQQVLGLLEKEGMVISRNVDNEAFRALMQPIYDSYRTRIGAELFDSAMKLLED